MSPAQVRAPLLLGILLGLGASYGCATDCDVACGKLEFCEQLPGVSRSLCIDRCREREPENGKQTEICSDCLDNASCRTISRGTCGMECQPVVGPRVDGEGGAGGSVDAGGEGGAGGSSVTASRAP